MKANELMIEDWVDVDEPNKYAGAIGRIMSLQFHNNENAAYFQMSIQGKFGHCTIEVCSDDLRPIPLTAEILEKNGFRIIFDDELHISYFQDIKSFHIEVKIDKIGIYQKLSIFNGLGDGVTITECQFVHQLQHALRLCGIDKTIEL